MGQIISTIGSDINTVATTVAGLVTDVSTAIESFTKLAEQFNASEGLKTESSGRTFVISYYQDGDLPASIKNALNGAKTLSEKTFTTTFGPAVVPAGTDSGCVMDYVQGTSFQCVIDQINRDFKSWQINADSAIAEQMADTIVGQIQAQQGLIGSSKGRYNINLNQVIDWTVSYGLNGEIGNGKNALVYGFSAALDGGW